MRIQVEETRNQNTCDEDFETSLSLAHADRVISTVWTLPFLLPPEGNVRF